MADDRTFPEVKFNVQGYWCGNKPCKNVVLGEGQWCGECLDERENTDAPPERGG